MRKALKSLLVSSFILVLSFVAVQAVAQPAYAVTKKKAPTADTGDVIQGGLCKGGKDLGFDSGSGNSTTACNTDDNAGKLNSLIKNIINIFSVVVGIVAVIMIIVGGFRYITSGGDSGNVTTAKNTILYALVGLVIVALAQFIVRFVLEKSTGLTNG
jgi:cytochrome bd-type quinol oxidase subunit 2